MAPVLAWGLAAAAPIGFLLLLFLCAFWPRAGGRFSIQSTGDAAENSGLVTLSGPGCSDGGAALLGGNQHPTSHSTTSLQLYNRNNQDEEGNFFQSLLHLGGASPRSRMDVTDEGNVDIPGSPRPRASPKPPPRTPDFLRHRQLPLVPGDTTAPAADTGQDAQGPIYESIRYKSQKLNAGLEIPCKDDESSVLGLGVQEFVVQEEPCVPGSPIPVYARICKVSRAPQHTVANSTEPEEEAAPALPEKHFDIL